MSSSVQNQSQNRSRKRVGFTVSLIILTFLLKVSLGAYFSYLIGCKNPERAIGYLSISTGDTFSYIGSIDNFVSEGIFYFWNGERRVLAGRMPYYGAPYYFLRLLFDKSLASDLFILLQIFFDTLATVYFARFCSDVLKRRSAFWLGYGVYLLSFNPFITSLLLAPESLSISFMVLFFYAFHRYWSGKDKSKIWVANAFLSLSFVLKPYLAPFFLAFLMIYCYRENLFSVSRIKTLIGKTALLSLPIVLLLLPWFVRNLIVLHRPIATQENLVAGYKESKADEAFRRFSGSWGGDFTYWDAQSAACYFKFNPPTECTFTLPDYSLTDEYGAKDVEDVRSDYIEFQKNPSPELEQIVVDKFDRLTAIYKSRNPFMFYIGSGLFRIKTMLWHTNNYYLPVHPSSPCYKPYQLWFKAIQSIVYYLSLSFGLFGLIALTIRKRISLLFAFVPLFLMCFFSFYVWNMEARYFAHAYPVMLLGLVGAMLWAYSGIKKSLVRAGMRSSDKLD